MNFVSWRPTVQFFRSAHPILICSAVWLFTVAAQAETRVALVIGNGDYKNTGRLANPRNDATDIAAALTRDGFEVITGFDLDRASMEDAESRFARKARDADAAIFYYSGHAIQYAGTNYLLPVDATIRDSTDLRRLAKVDDIVDDVQQAKTLRVLILDSCRDNPLADELKRALGSARGTSVQRGLARIDNPRGMIVAYSTQAGQTADDGTGRNSPFTAALLQQIETPEEISTVFRRTAAEVARGGRQLPELSLSFFGDFYLKAPVKAAETPPTSQPAKPSDPPIKEARLPTPLNSGTSANVVAILTNGQQTGFAVSIDPNKRTFSVFNRLANAPPGKTYVLWLISEKLGRPRALGTIESDFTNERIIAADSKEMILEASYAVTIEPKKTTPITVPTGPPLYVGKPVALTNSN
jgi:hypothetical protein